MLPMGTRHLKSHLGLVALVGHFASKKLWLHAATIHDFDFAEKMLPECYNDIQSQFKILTYWRSVNG